MPDTCKYHVAHEQALDNDKQRLNSHGRSLDSLAETNARTVEILSNIERRMSAAEVRAEKQEARIVAIENKPAKKWETVTGYIMTAVVALIIGAAASQIGLA